MGINFQNRYVRLLIIVALPIILAVFFALLYFSETDDGIYNVQVTNLTDNSATIIWQTESSTKGEILVSEDDSWKFLEPVFSSKETFYDDRNLVENDELGLEYSSEIATDRTVHYVTVSNLEPETKYYFRIKGTLKAFQPVDISSFDTKAVPEEISFPDTAYGEVIDLDSDSQVTDGIVLYYMTSEESNRISDKFSSIIENGTYTTDLNFIEQSIPTSLVGVSASNLYVSAISESGEGNEAFNLNSQSTKPLDPLYINFSYFPELESISDAEDLAFAETIDWPIKDVSVTDNCCGVDRQCSAQHEWEAGFYDYAAGKCGGGGGSGGNSNNNGGNKSEPPANNSSNNSGTKKWTCGSENYGTHCVDTKGKPRCISTYMEQCGSGLYRRVECGSGGEFYDKHGCIFNSDGSVKTSKEEADKALTCPLGSWEKNGKCVKKDSGGNEQTFDPTEGGHDKTTTEGRDRDDANKLKSEENDSFANNNSGNSNDQSNNNGGSGSNNTSQEAVQKTLNLTDLVSDTSVCPGGTLNTLAVNAETGSGAVYCDDGNKVFRIGSCTNHVCDIEIKAQAQADFSGAIQEGFDYISRFSGGTQEGLDALRQGGNRCGEGYETNFYIDEASNSGKVICNNNSNPELSFELGICEGGDCRLINDDHERRIRESNEQRGASAKGAIPANSCESKPTPFPSNCLPGSDSRVSEFRDNYSYFCSKTDSDLYCPNSGADNQFGNCTPNVTLCLSSDDEAVTENDLNHDGTRCVLPNEEAGFCYYAFPDQSFNGDQDSNTIFKNVSAQTPPTPNAIDPKKLKKGTYQINIEGFDSTEIRIYKDNVEVEYFIDSNGDGKKQSSEPEIDPDVYSISLSKSSEIFSYEFNVGWNLISPSFVNSEIDTASELLERLWEQQVVAIQVSKYTNGTWIDYISRIDQDGEIIEFGSDFSLVPGESYFVRTIDDGIAILEGQTFVSSVPINISKGWNLIGIQSPNESSDAQSFLNTCTEQGSMCTNISRLENQRYQSYVEDEGTFFGNNFQLNSSEGYFVLNTGNSKTITP